MDVKEILKEIENLSKEDLDELKLKLDKSDLETKTEDLKERIESNKDYVGRCYKILVKPHNGMFPEMYKYIKVISERSSNEYRLSSLVFLEHPIYWFDFQRSKVPRAGNNYLGDFRFLGIHLEDYPFFCYDLLRKDKVGKGIDFLTEISLEEYNNALDNYIEELKNLTWTPNHFRFGGKLPIDKEWSDS